MEPVPENEEVKLPDSQTASEFINQQLALEADAREVLPYKFDKCTNILGPLRQNIFACLTCSPPPASAAQVYTTAGVCYACSISCHGEHTLVELFSRRDFVCDCGTSRLSSTSPCTLRSDPVTGNRGVHSQQPHKGNHYNQNFQNRFCACREEYDADSEKGTMFQCLGLGTVETGGCGEDWYHPECLIGLPRGWYRLDNSKQEQKKEERKTENAEGEKAEELSHPVPLGFPNEDDFAAMICYKCVESNPWIKKYAGTPGFLPPVFRKDVQSPVTQDLKPATAPTSLKRKASNSDLDARPSSPSKRVKDEADTASRPPLPSTISTEPFTTATDNSVFNASNTPPTTTTETELNSKPPPPQHKHSFLPSHAPTGIFTLFLREDFRDHLCHCPQCYPNLIPHPHLLEDEETYEPSLSSDGSSHPHDPSNRSHRSSRASLLERGEAALSNVDRVRAIEGVMVYNHLRDKVKQFLRPYAEEGRVVSAEDIKAYFEKLRGDEKGITEEREKALDGEGDNRQEQSGY